jgi:hypothetical protein
MADGGEIGGTVRKNSLRNKFAAHWINLTKETKAL